MNNKLVVSLACILTISFIPTLLQAKPNYTRQFKQEFGYIPSCQACHTEGGGTPLNNYGKDFKTAGKNLAAFKKIANLDSDKDGSSNAEEASAKSNPGDRESTPKQIGEWLDLSSLVPKAVQLQFPDATAWKPFDALLTDADIKKAESFGVIFNADDENTIYIPIADRRPIGSALIYPATYEGKTFFLLLTTDRQLNFASIHMMEVGDAPALPKADIFTKWMGKPVQSLEVVNDNSLIGAISQATKKAGVLIYLRLKGA